MRSEDVPAIGPSFQLGNGFRCDFLKSSIGQRTALRRSNSESSKQSQSLGSPYHSIEMSRAILCKIALEHRSIRDSHGSKSSHDAMCAFNPTIRANRQVVVRQYTRGLRIALEFNDVLVSVVRGHELSLRAAAEATNVLNCLDVHCEIPFCGGHAELGTDQRRDHVLRGGPLERNFFVWHCTLLVAFIGPVSSIAVASRIKELHPVNVNKIPVFFPPVFLSSHDSVRLRPSKYTRLPLWRYSPAISARLPNAFMLGVRRSCPSNAR